MKLSVCLLACGLLAGCASSPSTTYYQLSARAASRPMQASTTRIEVGPVTLPAVLDRPQMVLNGSTTQLTILDQSRWAAPLSRMIAQTVADNLSRELGLSQVHAYPQSTSLPSDFKLWLDVRALQATLGQGVHLELAWSVVRGNRVVAAGSMVKDVAQTGQGMDGLVTAQDLAFFEVSHQLTGALQPLL